MYFMDRMTSMTTFVKVVETGGFAAAGRKLGMSPSTVTGHVQALEERLGVRLLNRSTRKLSLTEVGKAYFDRTQHILADLEEVDSMAQALNSTPRGQLRLNASVTVPPLLAPVIAEFTALHPDVTLSMAMSDRMVDLVDEGFDLAIRLVPVPDSSLIVRRIGSYRLVVCGAPDYLARRGIPRAPGDLAGHNCLSFSQSPWSSEWRFNGADGETAIQVTGNLETNSANALRLAAVHGQGLAMMPSFLVVDEVKSGRLVPLLTEFSSSEYPISAIYPHRHHLSAKVRSFLDLLTKRYRENPAWADPCRAYGDCLDADDGAGPQLVRAPMRSSNAAVG
jgi:DNA-binding transcriptional LysR family regulator